MRIVSAQELEDWLASGKVLERDARGPKVVALPDNRFLKIFHTRRYPLLARLQPAAHRFAENALALQRLKIPTPDIIDTLWIDKRRGLTACIYQPLAGISIQDFYLANPNQVESLLPSLAAFIRTLHKSGIYFRSLHFGNIILLPNHQYGLIDFLDIKFKSRPLRNGQIARNFRHLERYLQRRAVMSDFPIEKLHQLYKNT